MSALEPVTVTGVDMSGRPVNVVLQAGRMQLKAAVSTQTLSIVTRDAQGNPTQHRSDAMTSDEITKELAAAVADGRIPESGKTRWRAILASRGEVGAQELRSLQSVTAILAAPKPAAKPTKKVAASSPADPGVVADPSSGALSWNGLPVTPSSDGTPLVHTVGGAMTVDAFKAAGLDPDLERVSVGLAHITGSAKRTGLPTRNPLFGGS